MCPQADTRAEREGNAIAHHGRDHGTHARLHGQRVHQARASGKYIDLVRSRQDASRSVDQSRSQTGKLCVQNILLSCLDTFGGRTVRGNKI